MTKRSPTEFTFSKILRTSGIEPGSPESILLADLDDLKLDYVRIDDFIAAVAEVVHDKQEHEYMDRGWMLKMAALKIAGQMLLRGREFHLARSAKVPLESLEEFSQMPAENLQRRRRDQTEVN